MGNVMTSAVSAADVIMPMHQQQISKTQHHEIYKSEEKPPPECPMHKSASEKESSILSSECPINDMTSEDINPLNMVIISSY